MKSVTQAMGAEVGVPRTAPAPAPPPLAEVFSCTQCAARLKEGVREWTQRERADWVAVLAGLKREWLIGVRLNKLRGPDGELEGAPHQLSAQPARPGAAPGVGRRAALTGLSPAGFMGTGAALMRRDGGVEGLVLEKVNGLPLDKRCAPAALPRTPPGAVAARAGLRLAARRAPTGRCCSRRLWKDEQWADAMYTLSLLKQACKTSASNAMMLCD